MGDYYSDSRKSQDLWQTARKFINVYYGHEESETLDKIFIEQWCKEYKWTPEDLARELGIEITRIHKEQEK